MKILIIYNSKYGSSKKYAFILGRKLNGDIINLKNVSKNILKKYDLIIFGSGIYEERIRGLKRFLNFNEILKEKLIILYIVGIEKRSDKKYKRIKKVNSFLDQGEKIFYLMGSYTYKKLKLIDKIKMTLFLISLLFKFPKSEEEKMFLNSGFGHINYYDEEGLIKILFEVNKMMKKYSN